MAGIQKNITNRKSEHIQICLTDQADFSKNNSRLDNYELIYDALPEIDFAKIQIDATLLGKNFSAPILVGSMTGGCAEAIAINQILARFCTEYNLPLALGSCRSYLENGNHPESFELRKTFPKLPFLFGNLGAIQLNNGIGQNEIELLIDKLQLDGIIFHLNPLQEALQMEGNTNFAGLMEKLMRIVEWLQSQSIPVSIKEVGAGISSVTAKKISQIKPDILEVAGTGGTSWAYVESLRSNDSIQKHLGEKFKHFGVDTVTSILNVKNTDYEGILIASGGIRHGVDIFKYFCLGADFTALAQPFLKMAYRDLEQNTFEALPHFYQQLTSEIKLSCFLTGIGSLKSLVEKNTASKTENFTKIQEVRP